MDRTTEKDLQDAVDRINRVTHSPLASYANNDGVYMANTGNYHVSFAYGGASLHRMGNESGGIEDVFRCGHIAKRDLYERMNAFLKGLESAAA
jgi:hypothetical protein